MRKTVDVDLTVYVDREYTPRTITVRCDINQSENNITKEALVKGKKIVEKWKNVHVTNICIDFINYPEE